MIAESTYENSSNSLLEELNWHQLSINRKKLKAILMYKTINKRVPKYLQDIFTSRSRSPSYDGAVLWNSLPTELRSAQSLIAFKRGLECWLA